MMICGSKGNISISSALQKHTLYTHTHTSMHEHAHAHDTHKIHGKTWKGKEM